MNSHVQQPSHPQPLCGALVVPGDKSISHRAVMLSGLISQRNHVSGLLQSADVQSTMACFQALGAIIEPDPTLSDAYWITGPKALQPHSAVLDAGNSGTTIRLMSGILAAQPFTSTITGDASLQRRPMGRVISPLSQMGAHITGQQNNTLAPLTFTPNPQGLQGIAYTLPMASAQVKSAILLAGLFAQGATQITEPAPSRDHTERMLAALGVPITTHGNTITLASDHPMGLAHCPAQRWQVPGDFSSAAFFMVAALLTPGSEVVIQNVGLNPGRIGLLTALQSVGADITIQNPQTVAGEPVGDLRVCASRLRGNVTLDEPDIPALIDEIPILAVAGIYLDGTLTVRGAEELRHKESDRITAIQQAFDALQMPFEATPDGFTLSGDPQRCLPTPATALDACHDHRIAMALAVLNHVADPTQTWSIQGREWVRISFPTFDDVFARLVQGAAHV
jgi:3-phosphoshikimate 1-carboxyvinyltransferase